jgi:hypothetical protein
LVKTAPQFFEIIYRRQPPPLSQVPGHVFRITLVMVFAHVLGERAPQKPRHPFGAGAWFIRIPGHFPALSAAKSAVTP